MALELQLAVGFAASMLIAFVTTPVGVSGALFLLPLQLELLKVPSPAVTPTNLLYNVVSGPGALARYWRQGQRPGVLTAYLLAGTVPGIIIGAFVRVYAIPDVRTFRLVAAAVLFPIGIWLITRTLRHAHARIAREPSAGFLMTVSLPVGVIGGIYGIGGGSLLAPILVAFGISVARVAPAALAATFVNSAIGAFTFWLLAHRVDGTIAPEWTLGVTCGVGGLIGGYLGARWQRRLPERHLAIMLGAIATALGVAYLCQGLR